MKIENVGFSAAKNIAHSFDFVLSISDSNRKDFCFGHKTLTLAFDDIVSDAEPGVMPNGAHMRQMEHFFRSLGDSVSVLIHCRGGVSRSAAATLFLLMIKNDSNIAEAVKELFEINPLAAPNEWMVAWIDRRFNCNGVLVKTVDRVWAERNKDLLR